MTVYSDLPYQCDIDAYKNDMKALKNRCDEINNEIKKQYFSFYQNLIALCNEKVFADENVCCINGYSLLTDTVNGPKGIRETAEKLLENNKNITSWITSRGVWYELAFYYDLWLKAKAHIDEICTEKKEQEDFNRYTDPDCAPLCTFADNLLKCICSIERDYPAYTYYSQFMYAMDYNLGLGGGGGGSGRRYMTEK